MEGYAFSGSPEFFSDQLFQVMTMTQFKYFPKFFSKSVLAAVAFSAAALAFAQDTASSSGVVRRINPDKGTIAIKGQAIDDLKIPAMILEYQADKSLLQGINVQDKVRFTVQKEGDKYRITEIKK